MLKIIATNPRGQQVVGTPALAIKTLGDLYFDLVRNGSIRVKFDDGVWAYRMESDRRAKAVRA